METLKKSGSQWNELSGTLTKKRWTGEGVVIKDNNGGQDKLWLIGGQGGQTGDLVYSDGTIEAGPYPLNYAVEW